MKRKLILLLMLSSLLATLFVGTALAASGGDYVLDWSTIDGGGGTSSGGDYQVSGTIGQPDAGGMSGGRYALSGGFWGRLVSRISLFLPLILR